MRPRFYFSVAVAFAFVLGMGANLAMADLAHYWSFDDPTGATTVGDTANLYNPTAPPAINGTLDDKWQAAGGLGHPTWDTVSTKFGGKSMDFTGANSSGQNWANYVTVGDAGLNGATNATISMWVEWTGTQIQAGQYSGSYPIYGSVFGRIYDGGSWNQDLVVSMSGTTGNPNAASSLRLQLPNSFGNYTDVPTPGTPPAAVGNGWHNLVLTANATSWNVFMDGTQIGTNLVAGLSLSTSTYLYCIGATGQLTHGLVLPSTSTMDDVGVFNGANGTLSAGKAEAIYWVSPSAGGVPALSGYNLGIMSKLFSAYDSLGSYTGADGLKWSYVGPGTLTGGIGNANQVGTLSGGGYYIELGADGSGLTSGGGTTPEPGTLALLTAGLLGLLCYAWRKRR